MNKSNFTGGRPDIRIAIGWEGMPPYAAAGLRATGDLVRERMTVLATSPGVAFHPDDLDVGKPVIRVEKGSICSWRQWELSPPDLFIHTGWAYRHWNSLADEVLRSGGKVVIMVDNCYKRTLRQRLGGWYFRLRLKHRYSAVWVPGKSGFRLISGFGMSRTAIYQGLYGADTDRFRGGAPLAEREKTILFSGQLIHRKGIDLLLQAWSRISERAPAWRLVICGSGEYAPMVKSAAGAEYRGFVPPQQLADLMRLSRFFVLPSREEHWGVVVHEAACSGCGLLLADAVGAMDDLLTGNGHAFESGSAAGLADILLWATQQEAGALRAIEACSRGNALSFGSKVCGETLEQITTMYTGNQS
jgi:glycosyltransferase involved in cell wall biosynthesis